jgi:hypothetical protein
MIFIFKFIFSGKTSGQSQTHSKTDESDNSDIKDHSSDSSNQERANWKMGYYSDSSSVSDPDSEFFNCTIQMRLSIFFFFFFFSVDCC